MMTTQVPICGEHRTAKEWCQTTFMYEDEGVSIRIPNIYAWVCPQDGDASFTSETVDELIETVRELIETAKRARNRQSALTEYLISVGQPVPLGSPAQG